MKTNKSCLVTPFLGAKVLLVIMTMILNGCVTAAKSLPSTAELSKDYVELRPEQGLVIDLRYATTNNFVGENMYGTFNKPYLHKLAADKLSLAIQNLKAAHPKYKFIIFDALRPRSVQYVLWEKVKGTEQEIYVANPKSGSVHNYGFAVDLSVVDEAGKELDMGTPYDNFTTLAHPEFEDQFLKEGKLTQKQIDNRLILRNAMVKAGFAPLTHEWWHFDALPKAELKQKFTIVE